MKHSLSHRLIKKWAWPASPGSGVGVWSVSGNPLSEENSRGGSRDRRNEGVIFNFGSPRLVGVSSRGGGRGSFGSSN